MATVQTVRGPVDVEALGPTLMHEHIFVLTPEVQQNLPQAWDEEERVADAAARLRRLRGRGVQSIVDPTVYGLGRHIPRVQRVCADVDINVVVASGAYTYRDLPFYFQYRTAGREPGQDALAELFVAEVADGIADTGVRAGILKCATDRFGLTRDVERVLRACARAHRRTGVPITTHTHAGRRQGLEQQRVFREEGVDLSRVVIGHCGDSTDLDYLESLVAAGSYIGMDRFGLDVILPTEQRVDTIVRLCGRGHADRMVLSHDAACWIDWMDPEVDRAQVFPRWHYTHICDDVLPMLRARGVAEADVQRMLVGNPRDLFARQGAY
jgi:phosphotriesterase-related protein